MKATELMIGDWVSFEGEISIVTDLSNDENGEFPPIQVYNEEYGVSGTYRVEPIPLTEDILKANGFKYTPLYGYTYFSYEWLYLYHKYENRFYLEIGNKLKGGDVEINYIHQLQHALRLCGFDELADNFKAE